MEKIVIDVVGPAGSGKSKLCKYICNQFGFTPYRPSDVLRSYAAVNDIQLGSRQDYINIHHKLIEDDPMAIIRPVLESPESRICLDGMRAPLPFLELRKKFGATLIHLECPAEQRLERIQNDATRSGHRINLNLAALIADEAPDMRNSNRHLPNMVEMKELADYVLDASGPFYQVTGDIDMIMTGLLHPASQA